MKRRLLACLLILAMLPCFPTAQAAEEATMESIIASQYDAFAATVYQENAANNALDQLLDHGFYGKGKNLSLDQTSPVAAAMFHTGHFRNFMIQAISHGISRLDRFQADETMVGCRYMLGWHDFGREYNLYSMQYNETATLTDDFPEEMLIPNSLYTGPKNKNDEALVLTAGSVSCIVRLHLLETTFSQRTCRVDIQILDSFSFSSDYSIAEEKGFNTTFSKLLCVLGPLIGLKSYEWSINTSFTVVVPNNCAHSADSYRWEKQGAYLESLDNSAPMSRHIEQYDGNDHFYYSLETPLVLSHSLPWAVEFRADAARYFSLTCGNANYANSNTFLYKGLDRVYFDESIYYGTVDPKTGYTTWSYYAREQVTVPTEAGEFPTSGYHTYRLENRLNEDGTNQIYLFVDGEVFGVFSARYRYESEDRSQNPLPDDPMWLSGKDIVVGYIMNRDICYPTSPVEYLQIDLSTDKSLSVIQTTTHAANCAQPAMETRECILCGAVETVETAPAAGHKEEVIPGKAASCTDAGMTDGKFCGVCGEILVAQTEIPSHGHATEILPGKAPTCVGSGLTEGKKCSLCGEVLIAQENLSALGHSFENGFCSRCAGADPNWLPGDADGDGRLSYQDALVILRASIDLEVCNIPLCDVDKDGALTYQDALTVLRRSIGLT